MSVQSLISIKIINTEISHHIIHQSHTASYWVDDFHRYDISSSTWQQLEPLNPEQGPSPRHSHSSVVNDDHMYVFGGYDGHYRNDLYKYNFKTNTW